MKIGVHKIPMASPDDTSALADLLDRGALRADDIVAVIGKTEGNGGANDFTRGYATLAFKLLLAGRLSTTPDEIGKRVIFIWSGGTEGVLAPHATVFTRTAETGAAAEKRLALGRAESRALAPEEVGTVAQVDVVTETVARALADAGIADLADVHYVQVKGPLLTGAAIADADRRGATLATRDPNGSKPLARGAMALGVAVALGEVDRRAITNATIGRDLDLFSRVAATSAGGELKTCEVLVLGNSAASASDTRIGHAVLQDVLDADGLRAAIADAASGKGTAPVGADDVAIVFAKAEASPTGRLRGWRNTMLSDADIHYERHARAALGAVIASVTGDPAIFVSGGTEHQCAPGDAPVAVIVRRG
jgi:cyanuric acid amidohydrolase